MYFVPCSTVLVMLNYWRYSSICKDLLADTLLLMDLLKAQSL